NRPCCSRQRTRVATEPRRTSMLDPTAHGALRALKIAALAAALSACTVGPDYVRPDTVAPERFAHAVDTAQTAVPSPSDDAFWLGFGDPLLDRLVADAFGANHDLRIALATWDRAKAQLRGSRFDALPVVTASTQASDTRASADQQPGIERAARDQDSYGAGIDASWVLDLFG